MKPTIVFDSTGIELRLTKIQRSLPQMIDRALIQTAIEGASLIADRTKSGVSYSGGAFKPYSSRYRLFRIKKGAKTSPVDLNLTGKMMGSMASSKVSRGVAKIYFTRGKEAKKAAFNDKMRPFFGFNRQEQGRLQNFFERRI